jgi:hypothetical protein
LFVFLRPACVTRAAPLLSNERSARNSYAIFTKKGRADSGTPSLAGESLCKPRALRAARSWHDFSKDSETHSPAFVRGIGSRSKIRERLSNELTFCQAKNLPARLSKNALSSVSGWRNTPRPAFGGEAFHLLPTQKRTHISP